eukprot:106507-Pelagomonas_calceolata.AAC.1
MATEQQRADFAAWLDTVDSAEDEEQQEQQQGVEQMETGAKPCILDSDMTTERHNFACRIIMAAVSKVSLEVIVIHNIHGHKQQKMSHPTKPTDLRT